MSEEACIVLSTFPNAENARKISYLLVEEKLVACANIVPAVASIYFWEGKIGESEEALAIFKLRTTRYAEFETRLRKLHPYEVPEIIRLKIDGGNPDYLRWIAENCARG